MVEKSVEEKIKRAVAHTPTAFLKPTPREFLPRRHLGFILISDGQF